MPKKTCAPPKDPAPAARRQRARVAFDAVVESIHEDHRMLEGQDLYDAVIEVFGLVRPEPVIREKE